MVQFIGVTPVSYTHLDVYKRQAVMRDFNTLNFCICVVYYIEEACIEAVRGFTYLETTISEDGNEEAEMRRRLTRATLRL